MGKKKKEKKKKIREVEGAEYGVESRYASKNERLSEGKALLESRLLKMNELPDDQIVWARLLQLKLQMEESLGHQADVAQPDKHQGDFTGFLKLYIDTLYSKRSIFAKDMDISPVSLSQILNNHREPKVEFLLRLMIHSEQVYKHICPFARNTWFRIYYHHKILETMSRQKSWRPEQENHVHISEPMENYGKLLGHSAH